MRGSAVYANLHSLLDFIEAPHVLEVFEGASRGVAPRQTLPVAVDDEAVIDAVCRLLAEGVAQEAGYSREALLFGVPTLTEKGRRLYEALDQL